MIRDWSKASVMVEGTLENYPQAFTSKPTASFPPWDAWESLIVLWALGIHLCQQSDWGTIYSEWQRQGVCLACNVLIAYLHPDIFNMCYAFSNSRTFSLLSSPVTSSVLRFCPPGDPSEGPPQDTMLRGREEERRLDIVDKWSGCGERQSMNKFQLLSCDLGKLLHLPELPFPHLKNGDTNIRLTSGFFINSVNIC